MSAGTRWRLPNVAEAEVQALARSCGLRMPAARVLWARGVRDEPAVRALLAPQLSALHDPFSMLGMEAAVTRLKQALDACEPILLCGDYDVDGTLSVVMLRKTLALLGNEPEFHVPDRLKEGYGIQPEVLEDAARRGVRLVISVDTGIRASAAVAHARRLGLDVIVTDHHLPEDALPPALAILNPNQPGCAYPNKNLCGAGVTFKLIQALLTRTGHSEERRRAWIESLLMLVALATVADVVPLTGENRVLVKKGLENLPRTRNPGLRALMQVSKLDATLPVRAWDVAFRLGPRLNAAGRISHARAAIELFFAPDAARAGALAATLDEWNMERRAEGDRILREILLLPVEEQKCGLVFASPGWHRGVIGIVASRVAERHNRPTIILSIDEETGLAQGSARSIPAFHLLEALESIERERPIFAKFGGHRQAAGLTLERERVGELVERFDARARAMLSSEDLVRKLEPDAELRPGELDDASAAEVLSLEPFGYGFPEPLFFVRGLRIAEQQVFAQKHLRVRFSDARGASLVAKLWNGAEPGSAPLPDGTVDALVSIQGNPGGAARGYSPWDLKLVALRPA